MDNLILVLTWMLLVLYILVKVMPVWFMISVILSVLYIAWKDIKKH